jgi:peptidoglycan-associated lipoprotein
MFTWELLMLKTFKSFAILAVLLGLMAGCSKNKAMDDANTTVETDTSSVSDEGANSMDAIANVAKVFYFEFDQATLTSEARAALIAHSEYIKGASVSVRLEGHADERGSREYNMALGERRANAVRDFLVLQGVSSNIETVSFGEEQPAQVGSDESAWSQNRRVELKYQ